MDPKASIYSPCSEIGKKDPFLLLDIFSNDLKESVRLNELVHLTALEAAATAGSADRRRERLEERGEGGKEGAVQGKGAGRWGEDGGRAESGREESQEDARAAPRWAGVCTSPWLSPVGLAWNRFLGDSGGVSAGRGGGGEWRWPEPPLNLAKWQHLRAL